MTSTTDSEKVHNDAKNNENTLVLRCTITFSDDDLSEEAKKKFKFHEDISRNFQFFANHVLANDNLSSIGRHLLCTILERNYKNGKKVLNYVASHPEGETKKTSLGCPLIICGPPRTGSTFLHNLLACDPAARAPLCAEIEEPAPPIPRSDTAGQKERENRRQEFCEILNKLGLESYLENIRASHPELTYEADTYIFHHVGFTITHTMLAADDDNDLKRWLDNDTDKAFMYDYQKTFIEMVHSIDPPRSHWVFKSAFHTLYIDELLRHYPSLMLIMTHRRLVDAIPSAVRLMNVYTAPYFHKGKCDTRSSMPPLAERVAHWFDITLRRMVKFRSTHEHVPCFDVYYDDLTARPIDTIHRIYKHFGLDYTREFEMAMLQWLRDNPQGKQGRNTYTLNDCNITTDEIELRYKEYNDMFLNSQNSSKVDSCMERSVNPRICSTESSSNTETIDSCNH